MGGKKKSSPPVPKPIDPVAQAEANVAAQLAAFPKAAQIQFDINRDPEIGIEAQTRLASQARENVFSGEADIKNQLLENVLSQLQSPTGLSDPQQQAIDQRRALAQSEVQQALRNRANLGGGLFGGRAANTEQRAIQELQNQFAEEDIGREERNRLNNQQVALAIMQVLFPDVGLQQPQFVNPVVGANQQFAGATSQSNLAAELAQRERESQRALQGALFSSLGTAVGGFTGGTAFNNLLTKGPAVGGK